MSKPLSKIARDVNGQVLICNWCKKQFGEDGLVKAEANGVTEVFCSTEHEMLYIIDCVGLSTALDVIKEYIVHLAKQNTTKLRKVETELKNARELIPKVKIKI